MDDHLNVRSPRNGRIVDAAGHPVRGAAVEVVGGAGAVPEIGRPTDEEGRFRIGLPAGRYRLEATAAGGLRGTIDVDGGPGEEIVIVVREPRR